MRIATTLGFALLAICLIGATSVSAQVPNIAVYFDDVNTESAVCPGGFLLDTLYVVAQNIGTFINGVEYQITGLTNPYFTWGGDFPAALNPYSFAIGLSPNGISLGWPLPQNAFVPFIVQRILIFWDCTGCGPQANVTVVQHPATLFLGVAEFGTGVLLPAVGLTATVCASVATHETTWGKVKSLYAE
jgi:hypothetical protein